MSEPKNGPIPSLLDREATGGNIAEKGLGFQEGILLSLIPSWLARSGFECLIREAYGDAEAAFYSPGRGVTKEFVEVKDHRILPSEFWEEIRRFQVMDIASPDTYMWFRLVSAGISEDLHPLKNGLRRVRDPYDFYRTDQTLIDKSYADYEGRVLKLGHTVADAKFLFERVLIDDEHSSNVSHIAAQFKEELITQMPEYAELPSSDLQKIFDGLSSTIGAKLAIRISRSEIMTALHRHLLARNVPSAQSIRIHTAITHSEDATAICFDWERFFGGSNRIYPSCEQWNNQVMVQLNQTKEWILANHATRRVALSGERRLSTAIAIGATFSAVSGFNIDLAHRGIVYSTDNHPDDSTAYMIERHADLSENANLIVSLGIMRNIANEVRESTDGLGLQNAAFLCLSSVSAIVSANQANHIAMQVKSVVRDAMHSTKAKNVHLFYHGPSFLALFLGHRINGIGVIQCYEWTNSGYVATCQIVS